MDTILLTILALLFVIIIFLSLQPSNNIKTKQEDFGSATNCTRDQMCCPIDNLTDCVGKLFMGKTMCQWYKNRCLPKAVVQGLTR